MASYIGTQPIRQQIIGDSSVTSGNIIDGTVSGADLASDITISTTGTITTSQVNLGDGEYLYFGASQDLQIHHDGSNSYINEFGTGSLFIRGNTSVQIEGANASNMIYAEQGGPVRLFYNANKKIETTSTGVTVTGTLVADGLTVDTNTLYVNSSNNKVGIGTTSPTQSLTVYNTAAAQIHVSTANPAIRFSSDSSGSSDTTRGFIGYATNADAFMTGSSSGDLVIRGNSTDSVLIGTPSVKTVEITGSGVDVTGDLTVDTDVLYVDSTNNRVGIGTTSPGYPLHVVGSADGSQLEALTLTNSAGTTSSEVAIRFVNSTDIDNGPNATEISSIRNGTNDHDLVFSTSNGSVTERLRITSEGYVGIGTASPSYNLEVTGDAYVSTNLTVGGNLTVNGTTTTIDTTNTQVTDNLLELNSGATANTNDAGIIIERGSTGDNAIMLWDESADAFRFGTTTATASDTGNLTITESPVITGKLTVHTSDDTIFYSIPGSSYTNDQANAYFGFTSDGTSPGTTNYGYWSQFKITAGGGAGRSNLQIGMRRSDGNADHPDLVVTHEGYVGIGTSSPIHPLQVQGVIYTQSYIQLNSGQQVRFGNGNQYIEGTNNTSLELATGGSTSMIINNSGQVGIGTTSPSSILHIDAGSATELLRIDHTYSGDAPALIINNQTGNAASGSRISFRNNDTEEAAIVWRVGSGTSSSLSFHANNAERVRIDNNGQVGIGITSPEELLDLGTGNNHNIRAGLRTYLGTGYSTAGTILGHTVKANTSATTGSSPMVVTETNSGGGAPAALRMQSGEIEFHTASSGTEGATFNSERMRITDDGKVGIGTSTPNQRFVVTARSNFDSQNNYYGAWVDGNTSGDSFFAVGTWHSNGGRMEAGSVAGNGLHLRVHNTGHPLTLQKDGGNVGIGTTSPSSLLDVMNNARVTSSANTNHALRLEARDSFANDTQSSYVFISSGASGSEPLFSGQGAHLVLEGRKSSSRHIYYKVGDTTTAQHVMLANGNVGIGTLSPAAKLAVAGTITATGTITGPTTDTLLIKDSGGTTLKTIRGV